MAILKDPRFLAFLGGGVLWAAGYLGLDLSPEQVTAVVGTLTGFFVGLFTKRPGGE